MSKFGFWFMNARPQALPQSVIPSVVAICVAFTTSVGSWLCAVVALVGVICAHLSIDLLDDYFDYRNAGLGSREKLARAGMRARIGKAQYLADGQATLKQTFVVAALFGGVALICGAVVFCFRGWPILWFVLAGAFLGFFYSAPPFKLCYHGLGELLTGLMFGPLLMPGMCYAVCGELPTDIWWISGAIGLLVVNILYSHSIMDRQPDISVHKKTLAVLLSPGELPRRGLLLAFSCLFSFLPYLLILVAVMIGHLGPWSLLTFVTLPLAFALVTLIRDFLYHPEKEAQRRWWMGPMSQWKEIQEAGIEWFMIRWYLARNLISFFALIIAISLFIK